MSEWVLVVTSFGGDAHRIDVNSRDESFYFERGQPRRTIGGSWKLVVDTPHLVVHEWCAVAPAPTWNRFWIYVKT